MIKVFIKKNNNIIDTIKCQGHAGYDDYGKDIVCASFSTMIITTINAILKIDKEAISYTDNNDLTIVNIKKDNITNKLLENLINMIKELKDKYNKNIVIKEEDHD
ncbi:MAG: ribosomal-processing cysteine protease Prp [Tenericutes bacterium]|nr:ribosomal-processing cysteine protease Prp [Mycoplasmatota bacterium]